MATFMGSVIGKRSLFGTFGKELNYVQKNEHVQNKGRHQNKKMIGSSDRKMGSQKKANNVLD